MQGLRLACRALRATPVVTAVALLSLALGIGANTAIFSFVNSLILQRLPVADPPRLVILSGRRNSGVRPAFSYDSAGATPVSSAVSNAMAMVNKTNDAMTFSGAALLIGGGAMLTTYLAAVRARSTDVLVVLGFE
jgi:Na+/serine symporter